MNSLRQTLLVLAITAGCGMACLAAERRTITAVRATELPVIDGILDEKIWQRPGEEGFVQSEPVDGGQPSERTTVWVAFDNGAVYIAAKLEDSQPDRLVAPLARRDSLIDDYDQRLLDSDWFEVALDPYADRLSGFNFAINPAGSIADATLSGDIRFDYTWDGIWEGVARVGDQGWCVEIRIPFDQLRFVDRKEHVWGVNFRRTIKRKNEVDSLVWIPKGDQGYVSHFAVMSGIRDIRIRPHVEFLPYATGRADFTTAEPGNPFRTGSDYSANAGLDAKVGLSSNLTLDLSANPDFGQVEVDPAVINLTAFETFYQEKRPFFIEGAGIYKFGKGGSSMNYSFLKSDPDFFYSRRIGRRPQGTATGTGFVDSPEWTTILASAKISGKTGSAWNVGFLNVVTVREWAEIDDDGERSRQAVEPLAYYGVLRLQKEFNRGNQGFGLIATAVLRDLRTDNLRALLNRNAFSFGLDGWSFFSGRRDWVLAGWLGGTRVSGSPADMVRVQKSPQHYFQRPDAEHLHLDAAATSLSGLASRFTLNKEKGKLIFNTSLGFVSPGFDSTDVGFQQNGDFANGHVTAGYRWFKPGRVFRNGQVTLSASRSCNFGGDRIEDSYYLEGYGEFLNYWYADMAMTFNRPFMDGELTRGGVLMLHPASRNVFFMLGSDGRRPLVFFANGSYSRSDSGGIYRALSTSLRWKPVNRLSLSLGPSISFRRSFAYWIANFADPLMSDTGGVRTVFSNLELHTLAAEIRLNWAFNPKLSLQLYLQPYIAVGACDTFKELARPRSFDFNLYGANGSTVSRENGSYIVDPDGSGAAPSFSFADPDFSLKSLRGTLVLRWEYRPGSALYLVWTQNRADYTNPGDFEFGRDLNSLFHARGDDILMLKLAHRFK